MCRVQQELCRLPWLWDIRIGLTHSAKQLQGILGNGAYLQKQMSVGKLNLIGCPELCTDRILWQLPHGLPMIHLSAGNYEGMLGKFV